MLSDFDSLLWFQKTVWMRKTRPSSRISIFKLVVALVVSSKKNQSERIKITNTHKEFSLFYLSLSSQRYRKRTKKKITCKSSENENNNIQTETMVSLVLLPLKFELYPQRTNKKVSQGDSYNLGMKRRKQSICRPICASYLLLFI